MKLLKQKREDSTKQSQTSNDTPSSTITMISPPIHDTTSTSSVPTPPTNPAPMLVNDSTSESSTDDAAPACVSTNNIFLPVATVPIPTVGALAIPAVVATPTIPAVVVVPAIPAVVAAPINTKRFRPAATKNGRNLCAYRWLKQLMPNGSSQEFKVYWDSLEKTRQANYDIEASNLVAGCIWTANTVEVLAKFSSGTLH
ncbi:hypothetical protein BD769DRAFT_1467786 [Suillus cothurnatus]|nr:hypothetical protein BD769DRAFT_1467786 [Suillus cothurnatus]